MSSRTSVKKEFEKFAKRISKLESLRHEFDALNTKGFDSEARAIKAKLKDVGSVTKTEKKINDLKRKIEKRDTSKAYNSGLSKALLVQSNNLEKDYSSLRKRISMLEKDIQHRQGLSVKRQLSKDDVRKVKEIPKLEGQLKSLRSDFKGHLTSPNMKIDTGIGVLVDSKFGELMHDIKMGLTDELRKKKKEMSDELNADMKSHEVLFKERYENLVERFHENYQKKLHSDLKREVSKNFEVRLKQRVAEEKKRISRELAAENVKVVNRLEKQYKGKEAAARKEIRRDLEVRNDKMFSDEVNAMKNKMHSEMISKLNSTLREREKSIKSRLEREFRDKFRMELKKKEAQMNVRKAELEKHVVEQARKMFE